MTKQERSRQNKKSFRIDARSHGIGYRLGMLDGQVQGREQAMMESKASGIDARVQLAVVLAQMADAVAHAICALAPKL